MLLFQSNQLDKFSNVLEQVLQNHFTVLFSVGQTLKNETFNSLNIQKEQVKESMLKKNLNFIKFGQR